jgi:hypothetical protein
MYDSVLYLYTHIYFVQTTQVEQVHDYQGATNKVYAEILSPIVAIFLLISEIWKLRALKKRLRESLQNKYRGNSLKEATEIGTASGTWTHLVFETETVPLIAMVGPVLAAIRNAPSEIAILYLFVFIAVLILVGLFAFSIGPLDIEKKRGIGKAKLKIGTWLLVFQVVVITASVIMWAIVVL